MALHVFRKTMQLLSFQLFSIPVVSHDIDDVTAASKIVFYENLNIFKQIRTTSDTVKF